jgi:dimethylhistidine N-methyltransferase
MSTRLFDALSHDTAVQSGDVESFADAVRDGLTRSRRMLPSRYLYDDIGSALFDVIALLPEYGLTRADERVLVRHAASILCSLPERLIVAELGSGSARKTRPLLEALIGRSAPLVYVPIDISAFALNKCRQEMTGLRGLSLVGLERSYLDGLEEVTRHRPADQTLLVLFLGSTLGNFARPAADIFLSDIRRTLRPGDALLVGTDLDKAEGRLLLAYDDPLGVTAAFNRNVLARMNRELRADFVLTQFEHHIRYDSDDRRIEMHLRADRRQTVHIEALDLTCSFEAGETIWTESCHKFTLEELSTMAHRTGFYCAGQWVDAEWPFAESLWVAA